MIAAAGIMIVAPDPVGGQPTVLMLLRGPGSDHPYEWAFPGGQREGDETIEDCACRECEEECGLAVDPAALGQVLTRGVARATLAAPCACCQGSPCTCPPGCPGCSCAMASVDVDFTAFRHDVKAQFVPKLCDEHVGWCWAPLDRPPAPTHPGCLVTLQRPAMDELGVARAIAAGSLVSPQFYGGNLALFAIRITATGAAYRTRLGEYVWRDPSLYLNDEFLARCAGLPVIYEHPEKSTLTSDEFNDRVVGAVMFAYIVGQDVWAIARVYDLETITMMVEHQVSTSPAVVFRDPTVNEKATLEDGKKVLIETKPDLLDHIAICRAGVWDKGGDPNGVDRSAALEPGELVTADSIGMYQDVTLRVGDRWVKITHTGPGKFVVASGWKGDVSARHRHTLPNESDARSWAKSWLDEAVTDEQALADSVQQQELRGRALSLRARALGLMARHVA